MGFTGLGQGMDAPALPRNESARLQVLDEFQVLDTESEVELDQLTRHAAAMFDAPIGLISLVDADRQWFKSRCGLGPTQTERSISFCGHAILADDDVTVIPDARADPRFADNPLVTGEPHIGSYVGAKLTTVDGYALGTLCVISHDPMEVHPGQIVALQVLRDQAMRHLSLRRNAARAAEQKDDAGLRVAVVRDRLNELAQEATRALFGPGSATELRRRLQDEITHLQALLDEWDAPLLGGDVRA